MDHTHRQPVAPHAGFFGNWNAVYTRFRDWTKARMFERLFAAVSDEPDMEYAMVDDPSVALIQQQLRKLHPASRAAFERRT